MADKPDPENLADHYGEEETDKRLDATIRAMISMPPRSRPSPKAKTRPGSKGRVRKGKSRA